MVAINRRYEAEADLWWAWSARHGWVVLDRSVLRNRITHRPQQFRFVRGRDGVEYEQGTARWDYQEAARRLASLPAGEAARAEAELAALQAQYRDGMISAA